MYVRAWGEPDALAYKPWMRLTGFIERRDVDGWVLCSYAALVANIPIPFPVTGPFHPFRRPFVLVLSLQMNLASALWTGLIAGLAYSFMVRLMYRQHFAAMQRLTESQTAASGLSPSQRPPTVPIVTIV